MNDFTQSLQLLKRAQQVIPGGVNSPVRAFKGVGGTPLFFKKGAGAYLWDEDDHCYIDYVGSWGPLIVGHCHPQVVAAIEQVLQQGISYGAPTVLEIRLAEKIIQLMPSIEKIRFVNSGTEATMTAVRLARGFTGKNKIIKFIGCYHGHHDSLLVKAGSGLLTLGIPASPGIPKHVAEDTLIADFNDIEGTAQLFKQYAHDIAAVIVEPIAGNMGMILPQAHFLATLRQLCDQYNAVLIFDEVMTGFRVALGGAQAIYQITPDLTTLGKVIGGGMPVGAVGGRADIMQYLAPEGAVYQAGTLSGNPLAMTAGLATLALVEQTGFYEHLHHNAGLLMQKLKDVMQRFNRPFQTVSQGGMFGFCFNTQSVIKSYADMTTSDEAFFRQFYHGMLQAGIYLAPSMYEAGFISSLHGTKEIEATVEAAEQVMHALCV